jgi:2-(1,2-epoxy-1,2-dihydrophenyl)acetyl-CoA isomerase
MTIDAFQTSLQDGVFHIVLNRPEQGNVFNADFCHGLNHLANDISENAAVRAVLLTSTGRFFSVGGDIDLMSKDRAALPGIVKSLTSPLHMAIARLMLMNAPVVCAVNGKGAFGGAVALAAGADVLLAADTAKFGAAFTGIGFSCDSGTTVALSQRLGVSRAKRFLLLGETLTADDALQAGLVDKISPDEQLLADALAIAKQLAAGPTLAFGEVKRLFANVTNRPLASQLEEEVQSLAKVARSEDAWEGMTSFKQKRPAKFNGR